MNHNEKVEKTFAALDMELELLSKAQQQVILGGSGGGSNGDAEDPETKALLDRMVGDGNTASSGTFVLDSQSASGQKTSLRDTLKSIAKSDTGKAFLKKLDQYYSTSQEKITLKMGSEGSTGYVASGNVLTVTTLGNNSNSIATLTHELMHAYNDIRGGDTAKNVYSEIDAYILQAKVMKERGYPPSSYGVLDTETTQIPNDYTDAGQIYQNAMSDLVNGGDFTIAKFNALVTSFKTGSQAAQEYPAYADYNSTGPITVNSSTDLRALIREFLPNSNI